jgi:hypothetical protein
MRRCEELKTAAVCVAVDGGPWGRVACSRMRIVDDGETTRDLKARMSPRDTSLMFAGLDSRLRVTSPPCRTSIKTRVTDV